MFIKVNATLGFNADQVGWWSYELVAPPVLPLAEGAEGTEGAEETEAPVPQEESVPTLTLYMTTGGECVITGADAEKVRQYYSIPSSHLTEL